jgi:phosphoglycerate dehydrogenase-like enzyme
MKVLVPYPKEVVDVIRHTLGDTAEVVGSGSSAEEMIAAGTDADIVASFQVPEEYIHQATSLKMIQSLGAGIDRIEHETIAERGGVIVCNNHANAEEVAEYAIMLLLAAAKRIIISDREMRAGDWGGGWGSPLPNIELRHKTCLIIGLGHIGSEIAKRLRSFNMTLYAATRSGTSGQTNLVDRVLCIDDIEPIVREADFIILSVPLTKDSVGLVDKDFISLMKPTSVIVNISRGPIIDESALYDALKNRAITAAGLDVWWDYPATWGGSGKMPSEKYPYHELDNVVISPHRAAYSENIMRDQLQFVGENILRFVRGEQPLNQVDMRRGY